MNLSSDIKKCISLWYSCTFKHRSAWIWGYRCTDKLSYYNTMNIIIRIELLTIFPVTWMLEDLCFVLLKEFNKRSRILQYLVSWNLREREIKGNDNYLLTVSLPLAVLLCRSTVVHSNTIPPREHHQPTFWNVLPPQDIPHCCFCGGPTNQEKSGHVADQERRGLLQPRPLEYVACKLVPQGVAVDTNAFSFYHSQTVKAGPLDDRITMDKTLLQGKSQFSGIGATAAATTGANRMVGTAQFGTTRRY